MINFLFSKTPLFYWTQSLWRDEAFSVWISKDGLLDVVKRASGDFHTPGYYFLLNLWLKIFGSSEVALRGMSIVAFLISIYIVYLLSKIIFKKNSPLPLFITVLTATSPMLIYYAFELRMYSLLILFTVLSTYFFILQKFWPYVVSVALGLYTQPYMLFVLLIQNFDLLLQKRFKDLIKNNLLILLLFLPWIPILLNQLRQSGPMWLWPIDLNLILAVLGNLYAGYEGTPGYFWVYMKLLSAIIVAISAVVFLNRRHNKYFSRILLTVYLPLFLVLGISLFKPIYVLRYVIFVTLAEMFLLGAFLSLVKNKTWQYALFSAFLILNLFLNIYMVPHHTKVNIRQTFQNIAPLLSEDDVIYAQTPLIFYESIYYSPPNTQVFLYNPNNITPPRYVGGVGMPESIWANTFPEFPDRAFVIGEDGSYKIQSRL